MVISETKLGNYHRILVDESVDTWRLQFYDSDAAKWKDIIIYGTSDLAIISEPLILKDRPIVRFKGTEAGAIESNIRERGGNTEVYDATNATTLLRLLAATSLEFDVAVPVIFETAQAGLAANTVGVKFTSQTIIPVLMHYAKEASIEATWTASNTDSVTDIELYDKTAGKVISKVSGNAGTDVKSGYNPITEGNVLVVRVNVTTKSATAGSTTDVNKAVVYFRVNLA